MTSSPNSDVRPLSRIPASAHFEGYVAVVGVSKGTWAIAATQQGLGQQCQTMRLIGDSNRSTNNLIGSLHFRRCASVRRRHDLQRSFELKLQHRVRRHANLLASRQHLGSGPSTGACRAANGGPVSFAGDCPDGSPHLLRRHLSFRLCACPAIHPGWGIPRSVACRNCRSPSAS